MTTDIDPEDKADQAHRLAKDHGRHREAMEILERVARATSDPNAAAQHYQQAAVYATNARLFDKARELFLQAMEWGFDPKLHGSIMRDMARLEFVRGRYTSAIDLIELARNSHVRGAPRELAMDIGFRGRIRCKYGRKIHDPQLTAAGRMDLREADRLLAGFKDSKDAGKERAYREAELYNKLHLASWLFQAGSDHHYEARRRLAECHELLKAYGNWQHRWRFIAMAVFRWQGDAAITWLVNTGQRLANHLPKRRKP